MQAFYGGIGMPNSYVDRAEDRKSVLSIEDC
jgi:hypothetical protein